MAKFFLKAGAEVDFLSGEEFDERIGAMQDFFLDLVRGQEGETISRSAGAFLTDATGGTSALGYGGADVYRVPTGFNAFLLRLSLDYSGSNASIPVSCDVRICADQNTPGALRALNNQLPSVFHASRSYAPLFRSGQRVVVSITGGPVSTHISPTVQVLLVKTPATGGRDTLVPAPAGALGDPLDRP